ncbi:hypothetical protein GE21DRAFT_10430 [Neurospora crassa]|uniref:Aureobasidin-resistance protein n=1 Tax=Neurospora crassa (strain ATCC 24698 / 74-OR23-1A / CBS 708.71 / DSM 1257 / FGSC 987) TaxID=367110 RepID=Q7S586_NEUCR|nr:aureobasidin-resistance protein [Neurospora crassa OR74A]EAA30690.1 aureobasidin-resistance protein [Neurospora crassa OR74A]KAK3487143.1 hypothetical protein B0T13DRAFT_117249 [Neurospora crassa]KHE84845.1 hypothetical protein GE21DRAFT_10430 [Neurospora crassa]|eukprot:XP_959926.1 aureobasidin-resistance protein [Neurospora crassa OR74A]
MQDFEPILAPAKPKQKKLPFGWPPALKLSTLNPVPQRRRLRRKSTASQDNVAALKTSFDVWESIKSLQTRKWKIYDIQHVVCLGFILFSLFILPSAPIIKTAVLLALGGLLLMPITQQFFLPSLPIWTYLLYFFASRFIAPEYRPHIWVKVLPALENVLYGANLSNILSAHSHPVLDLLAWFPYGIGHFALPAICSAILFLFAAPGSTPVFARAFGYMCMLAVTIQLIFPCTPPWYEKAHGLEPAHYGMEGSPAGLARIDKLFGVDMYTTSFTTAPLPFGAFPSLHGANAVLEALFMQYYFPKFKYFFIFYVGWIWWATMYLNHHYAVDLVGGGLMAAIAYYISRVRWLPRPQLEKRTRWEYEYVEFGDRPKTYDEEYGSASAYGLGLLERRTASDSDEWTLGSSSSLDSLSRGDTVCGSSSSTPDILSPTTPNDDFKHVVLGLTPQGDIWNGGRLARESELSDVVVLS